jgi:hypothetical protein
VLFVRRRLRWRHPFDLSHPTRPLPVGQKLVRPAAIRTRNRSVPCRRRQPDSQLVVRAGTAGEPTRRAAGIGDVRVWPWPRRAATSSRSHYRVQTVTRCSSAPRRAGEGSCDGRTSWWRGHETDHLWTRRRAGPATPRSRARSGPSVGRASRHPAGSVIEGSGRRDQAAESYHESAEQRSKEGSCRPGLNRVERAGPGLADDPGPSRSSARMTARRPRPPDQEAAGDRRDRSPSPPAPRSPMPAAGAGLPHRARVSRRSRTRPPGAPRPPSRCGQTRPVPLLGLGHPPRPVVAPRAWQPVQAHRTSSRPRAPRAGWPGSATAGLAADRVGVVSSPTATAASPQTSPRRPGRQRHRARPHEGTVAGAGSGQLAK